MIINLRDIGLHVKYPLFLSGFDKTLFNLLDRVLKNIQILNFVKLRTKGAELYHAAGQPGRQTNMTKLVVACHNSANAPKN